MDHKRLEHQRGELLNNPTHNMATCTTCTLFTCTECFGSEAELPKECPGPMTEEQREQVAAGQLNYTEARGWYTPSPGDP